MQRMLVSRRPKGAPRSASPQPSILAEYVFFPFYDALVKLYPRSWMPNTVTLIGVSLTLLASLLLLSSMPMHTVFNPDHALFLPLSWHTTDTAQLQNAPLYPTRMQPHLLPFVQPAVLLVVCGVLNLMYCVADNTDGRLARRDGKASLTGEYLDHGLDCVTSLLSTSLVFCVNAVSMSNMATAVCFVSFATILCHTLNYERSVFIWGTRIASVDEAMIFFGIAMWLPVLFPTLPTLSLPRAPLQAVLGTTLGLHVSRLSLLELLYIAFNVAQAQTIFDLARRHVGMLLRLHVWFVVVHAVIMLVGLQLHTAHLNTTFARHAGACVGGGGGGTCALARTAGVPCYTLHPFAYPAVWIVTTAFTAAILVHVPIFAHCAKLPRVRLGPLAAVVLVWGLFIVCPVAAAAVAVGVHVVQVMYNLRYIVTHAPRKSISDDE